MAFLSTSQHHNNFIHPFLNRLYINKEIYNYTNTKIKVIEFDEAFTFFNSSRNHRVLQEVYKITSKDIDEYFKRFFDEKVDIGEFNNKTTSDLVKHFTVWLPKILSSNKTIMIDPPKNLKPTATEKANLARKEFLDNQQRLQQ